MPSTAWSCAPLTDAGGNYAFPISPPGSYAIEAEHAGFNTYSNPSLDVMPAAKRFDIAMTLESHSETVTVTDSPNQVQTVDTQIGGTLNATKMASIPVNGRSFTDSAGASTRRHSSQFATAQCGSDGGMHQRASFGRPRPRQSLGQRTARDRQRLQREWRLRAGGFQHGRGHRAQSRFHPGPARPHRQFQRRIRQFQRRADPRLHPLRCK